MHRCEKCKRAVEARGLPARIETIDACDEGGTCVLVEVDRPDDA